MSSYTLSILQDNIVGSLCMCKVSKLRFYMNLLFNRMDVPSTFFKSMNKLSQEKKLMLDSWLEQVGVMRECDGLERTSCERSSERMLPSREYCVCTI